MHWTTINGAPAGSVITLTAVLTGNVNSGANIYAYSSANKLTRPVDILEAFNRSATDLVDVPLDQITNSEYNNLPTKNEEGVPVQWHYDKVLGLSTSLYPGNGDFYLWPWWSDGSQLVVIKYIKEYDDLDAASNNPEFPQNWFLPIMLGLAWILSPKHGIPLQERKMLFDEAQFFRKEALDADVEIGSIFIQPRIK
jgi:hypothetical protein